MKTKQQNEQVITIPKIEIEIVKFKVRGITPLIVSKFSDKAKQMMLDKQMKKASAGKEAKNPQTQYESSIYKFKDGRTGFPATGFKAGMVRAGKNLGMVMTDLRGRFHVMADEEDLIEIKGEAPHMREDMVRLATGVADVRFRGEYSPGWESEITIQYIKNAISAEQLAQLLVIAGFSCGLGEWRPEKSNSGSFGRYELVTD